MNYYTRRPPATCAVWLKDPETVKPKQEKNRVHKLTFCCCTFWVNEFITTCLFACLIKDEVVDLDIALTENSCKAFMYHGEIDLTIKL